MNIDGTAFYCVCGRDFFLGAVALVNSLRLHGHTEPILVLDCGLAERERAQLSEAVTLVEAPSGEHPSTLKLVAPMRHPADVQVLLDSDLIVCRPLTEPIEAAAGGALVAFRNDKHRYFESWGAELGLGEVRDGPYVSSSAVFCDRETGREVLGEVARLQAGLDRAHTWLASGSESDPFFYFDQDVLNAVLHSRPGAPEVLALDHELAPIPPFSGVTIESRIPPRCRDRSDRELFVLHHASRKPWLAPVRSNPYSRLLPGLLAGEGVAVRLDPDQLPVRLRPGGAGPLARRVTDLALSLPGALRRLRPTERPTPAWPNERR